MEQKWFPFSELILRRIRFSRKVIVTEKYFKFGLVFQLYHILNCMLEERPTAFAKVQISDFGIKVFTHSVFKKRRKQSAL